MKHLASLCAHPIVFIKSATEQQAPRRILSYCFTDVRGALAAKSKEGFKEEVKKLISKYGAEKLSDINPDDYAALMKDVEGLGNG